MDWRERAKHELEQALPLLGNEHIFIEVSSQAEDVLTIRMGSLHHQGPYSSRPPGFTPPQAQPAERALESFSTPH